MSNEKPQFSREFDFASEDASAVGDGVHLTHVDDEASYVCDNCGEEIVISVDLAGGADQTYVEDCPVCCSPNVIHVRVEDDRMEVHVEPEQDRF